MPSYKGRKCQFCINQIDYVDYKNVALVKKYTSQYKKIVPKYYNGNCIKHQKIVMRAIKNARLVALIPFTT
ncbi:MAG: 30S ribosomal protein S18 [Candidatus Gracilibacteria bacterium]